MKNFLEIDFEKSYLWYSVSVSAGFIAMKLRDRVGELIDKKKINELQIEANEIFTKINILETKGKIMIYKVHWIVDGRCRYWLNQKKMPKKNCRKALKNMLKVLNL